MPIYKWEGKTLKGVAKKGDLDAPNEEALRIHLRQQGIILTKVQARGKEIKISLLFKTKVKQRSIAIFTRQLATMIDAGLPLLKSLDTLSSQQENKAFKAILR